MTQYFFCPIYMQIIDCQICISIYGVKTYILSLEYFRIES